MTAAVPDQPPPARRAAWRRALLALLPVVVYCVAAGAYFGPVVRHTGTYSEIGQVQRAWFPWAGAQGQGEPLHPQNDYPNSYYPRQVWLNEELRAGELPEWNPYSLGGSPLLANGGGITFHPLRYVLARTVAPAIVHDLFVLASMVAAGLGAHVLARELGARLPGAYLAGTAWMFNSTFLGWSQLEMMPAVIAGLPWALWALHRWRRTGRAGWAAVGGVAAALMPLGGSIDFAFAAYALCGVAALAWGQRGVGWRPALRERLRWRRLGGPVVFGLTASALGAPAILPFARLSPWLDRQPPSTEKFDGEVTVPVEGFLRALWPDGGPVTDRVLHRLVFAGTIVAVLAVVGLVTRGRRAALGRALALAGFLLIARTPLSEALGSASPAYRSLSLGRFLFVWALGLVLLASEGIDRVVVLLDARLHRGRHLRPPSRRRVVGVVAGATALVAVNAGQLFAYGRHLNPPFQPYDAAELLPVTPAIRALQDVDGGVGGGRYLPVEFATGARVMGASLPMAFRLETGAGYESTFLAGPAATWRIVAGENAATVTAEPPDFGYFASFVVDDTRGELLARNGITTVFSPPLTDTYPAWSAFAERAGGLERRYSAPDGEVWSLKAAAPRAFVVRGVEVADDVDAAVRRYQDPAFAWRDTVVLTADADVAAVAPPAGDGPPATVTELRYGNDDLELRVDAPAGGWLVVLDSWAPGWSASVDGDDAPVELANGAFRAVAVPPGTSIVRLAYRTPGLRAGVAAAGLAMVALAVWAVVGAVAGLRRFAGRRRPGPEEAGTQGIEPAPAPPAPVIDVTDAPRAGEPDVVAGSARPLHGPAPDLADGELDPVDDDRGAERADGAQRPTGPRRV